MTWYISPKAQLFVIHSRNWALIFRIGLVSRKQRYGEYDENGAQREKQREKNKKQKEM